MGSAAGWTWTPDPLLRNVKTTPQRLGQVMTATMHFQAPEMENWAKSNAPWTDRTSNARNGLTAQPFSPRPLSHGIVLFHQVPYGIWLEVKRSGEYAIIVPALREFGPRVMRTLNGILERI